MTYPFAKIQDLAAERKSALATGPFGSSIGTKTFQDEGVPVIRGSNLSEAVGSRLSDEGLVFIDPALAEKFARSKAIRGDLVFTCWGTVNQVGLIDQRSKHDEYIVSNKQMKLSADPDKANPLFLYYYFSSPLGQQAIADNTIGSSVPGFNLTALKSIRVPNPPLPIQNSIARCLGSLDDKIELNRRMNETLEEMARALFRDWFVDFGPTRRQMQGTTDPAAIMGDAFPPEKAANLASLFPAQLGDDGLPDGWRKQSVGELAEIVGGGTPNTKTEEFWEGGTHLWVTPRDLSKLSGVFIGNTERKLTDAGLAKVSSGLSPIGSVLMSSRAPIGYLAIASQPVAVNQGFIVMRPTDQFPTHFAKLWCEANMETIEANANGSTFQEISKKNFKPILVTVPETEVMAAFVAISGTFFEKIEGNELENETLAEMRDLLLPKLMSGEIRLSDGGSGE